MLSNVRENGVLEVNMTIQIIMIYNINTTCICIVVYIDIRR